MTHPRIMYLDHVAALSGGEIALLRLLKSRPGEAPRPLVVLGEAGELVSALETAGCEVLVVPLDPHVRDFRRARTRSLAQVISRVWRTWRYAQRVADIARGQSVEIIHANSLKSGFYGAIASRLCRRPLVWHLRDRLSSDYLPRVTIVLIRLAMALFATRVICNSNATRAALLGGRIGVISRILARRTCIILDPFDSATVAQRAEGPLETDNLRCVMVGRISRWKGQHVVLSAFAQADIPNSSLTIIGSPLFGEYSYEKELHEQARRLSASKISFEAFDPLVVSTLHTYDVLIHASTIPEPFGQVVVEGMSAGLLVIASDAGGPAEIVTNGVDGFLYRPGAVDALSSLLQFAATNWHELAAVRTHAAERARFYEPAKVWMTMSATYLASVKRGQPDVYERRSR